jgi:hypothetical protein
MIVHISQQTMPYLSDGLKSSLISFAAWIQNRFFEPNELSNTFVKYSHHGAITQHETQPVTIPGTAIWKIVPNAEEEHNIYKRIPTGIVVYEPATYLPLPLIQVVVQTEIPNDRHTRRRRQKKKLNSYDITHEMRIFDGFPKLDWLHIGMCVMHKYGVHVTPNNYSLSIIDGHCGMHTLNPQQAAIFWIDEPKPSPEPEFASESEPFNEEDNAQKNTNENKEEQDKEQEDELVGFGVVSDAEYKSADDKDKEPDEMNEPECLEFDIKEGDGFGYTSEPNSSGPNSDSDSGPEPDFDE